MLDVQLTEGVIVFNQRCGVLGAKEESEMKRLIVLTALALSLLVSWGALAKDRPILAVAEFKNQSGAGWWRGGVGWELAGMLSNELGSTGDFRLVERSKLESVIAEQNLAASGRIAEGQGAQMGQLAGAEYIVLGTVTAYEESTKSSGGGLSFKGFSVGGKSSEAYLAVDVRVVDANTGIIEYVRTIEGTSKGSGISFGAYRGGFGGALATESKTPAGKAIRAALMEITDYLGCVMVDQGRCMDEYDAKEDRRRDRTKSALDLD